MNGDQKKYRVLIVEDDDLIRESLIFKMKKAGFDVDSAFNGKIGLEKVKSDGMFSIVLLDLRMPENDGFKFLEDLRKIKEFDNLPVIILTNSYTEEFIGKALKLGAKGYLLKSKHDIQEIVDEVKKCLVGGDCAFDNS